MTAPGPLAEPSSVDPADRRRPPFVVASLIIAVAGALWLVVDALVTRWRIDELRDESRGGGRPWDWYPRRHGEVVDAHHLRVTVVVVVASVVAGALFVRGMRGADPHRAVRLCRWAGTGIALWFIGYLAFGQRQLGDDFAVSTLVVSTVAGIVAVLVVWLRVWTRTERGERSSLLMSWRPGQAVAAVLSFGLLLAAVIVAMAGGSDVCGTDGERGPASAALFLSLTACFFGLVLITLRRWFLGLTAMIAGGGLALLLLLALACLN